MDAIEFIREETRMCAKCQDCLDCPLSDLTCCSVAIKQRPQEEAEEVVRRVEKWSAAHPRKTRQSVFMKKYPDVVLTDGIINIKPCQMEQYYSYNSCNLTQCMECRRNYWLHEVK